MAGVLHRKFFWDASGAAEMRYGRKLSAQGNLIGAVLYFLPFCSVYIGGAKDEGSCKQRDMIELENHAKTGAELWLLISRTRA